MIQFVDEMDGEATMVVSRKDGVVTVTISRTAENQISIDLSRQDCEFLAAMLRLGVNNPAFDERR